MLYQLRLTQSDITFSLYFLVHELRPADIKVVAAVGDSLTVSHCVCQTDILRYGFY